MFKNEHCANMRNCYPYHGKPLSPSSMSSRLGNRAHAARPSEGMTTVPAGSHQPTGTMDEVGWGQRQRRRPSCCHRSFLTEAALYLLHRGLQLRGHHPALINGSVHWEGATHTHAPSTYKRTFVPGCLRG